MKSVFDEIAFGIGKKNPPPSIPDAGEGMPPIESPTMHPGVTVQTMTAPEVTTAGVEPSTPMVQATPTPKTYKEMYTALNPMPEQLSEEEQKKQSKREKGRAVISAIGDGISALSNLYFASKGAQSVPFTGNLSERNLARYKEAQRRREAKQEQWRHGMLNASYQDLGVDMSNKQLERRQQASAALQQQKLDYDTQKEAEKKEWEAKKLAVTLAAKENAAENERKFKADEGTANRSTRAGIAAQSNAIAKERLEHDKGKDVRARQTTFNKEYGDAVTLRAGEHNFSVGSKTLAANVGYLANDIITDYVNTKHGGNDPGNDMFLNQMKRDLNSKSVDPKRVAVAVSKYLRLSPTAQSSIELLSKDYINKRANVEGSTGEGTPSAGGGKKTVWGNTNAKKKVW